MNIYRIWKSTGEPEDIKANSVEFERKDDGLNVTFNAGLKKKINHTGVVALIEITPKKK